MTDRDEIIKQAVARVQSIETLDEFKAASDEIVDFTEKIMKSGIQELKTFLENAPSMTTEEQESMSVKFQDDDYILGGDVLGKEMMRLENLPGAEEYSEIMIKKFQEIMGPIGEEFGQLMEKFMDGLMNGFMGTLVDAMEAVGGAMGDAFDAGFEEPDTRMGNRILSDEDKTNIMNFLISPLYYCKSLSSLKQQKDGLLYSINRYLDYRLDDHLYRFQPGKDWEADRTIVNETQIVVDWLVPEMRKEFTRIAEKSKSPEAIVKIKDEFMKSIVPKISKLKEQLALNIVTWEKGGFL